jgi:hypothetical protein
VQQFKALDQQARDLANQKARIEMSGQARDYAAQLSELETRRVMANQSADVEMENIKSSYNSTLKSLDLQAQVARMETQYDYDAMAEASRQFGVGEQNDYAIEMARINEAINGSGGAGGSAGAVDPQLYQDAMSMILDMQATRSASSDIERALVATFGQNFATRFGGYLNPPTVGGFAQQAASALQTVPVRGFSQSGLSLGEATSLGGPYETTAQARARLAAEAARYAPTVMSNQLSSIF